MTITNKINKIFSSIPIGIGIGRPIGIDIGMPIGIRIGWPISIRIGTLIPIGQPIGIRTGKSISLQKYEKKFDILKNFFCKSK